MKRPYWITIDELHKVPNRANVIISGKIVEVGDIVSHKGQRLLSLRLDDGKQQASLLVSKQLRYAFQSATLPTGDVLVTGRVHHSRGDTVVVVSSLHMQFSKPLIFKDVLRLSKRN